jgi:hypothetical protein
MLHPYLKQEITQKNLFYLHLLKEGSALNSIVMLQSLHTLLDRMYFNGTFLINFNTVIFKTCAVFLKQ